LVFFESGLILDIIEIFKITRGNKKFSTKKRNFHVFSQRLSGTGRIFYKGETFEVNTRDIMYVPSNIEYTQETEGETLISIHVNIYNYSNKSIDIISLLKQNSDNFVFKEIYKEWSKKECGYKHRCTAMLYNVLSNLEQLVNSEYSHSFDVIRNSVNYLKANYTDCALTIPQLAALSNVSEVYFRKIFKRLFLVSPSKYITDLRIAQAKKMIESGYYKINEIAGLTGFSDTKYFSTVFKKTTGQTPTQYQNLFNMDA